MSLVEKWPFGIHKGKSIREVVQKNSSYINWLMHKKWILEGFEFDRYPNLLESVLYYLSAEDTASSNLNLKNTLLSNFLNAKFNIDFLTTVIGNEITNGDFNTFKIGFEIENCSVFISGASNDKSYKIKVWIVEEIDNHFRNLLKRLNYDLESNKYEEEDMVKHIIYTNEIKVSGLEYGEVVVLFSTQKIRIITPEVIPIVKEVLGKSYDSISMDGDELPF